MIAELKLSDWIGIVSSIGLIITLIYGLKQLDLAKKSSSIESVLHLHSENFEIRKKFQAAENQILLLESELKNTNVDFITLYGSEEYKELREIGYHYELIGVLVKNKGLDFKMIFDLFPFPDIIWKESKSLRKYIRKNYVHDYWYNFEKLKSFYDKHRIKQKRKN